MDIEIISFGYLHGDPPAAHLTLDVRHHFRDPHVSPELRHMTAYDDAVREAVATTPGISELLLGAAFGLNHSAIIHRDLTKPVVDRDSKGNRS